MSLTRSKGVIPLFRVPQSSCPKISFKFEKKIKKKVDEIGTEKKNGRAQNIVRVVVLTSNDSKCSKKEGKKSLEAEGKKQTEPASSRIKQLSAINRIRAKIGYQNTGSLKLQKPLTLSDFQFMQRKIRATIGSPSIGRESDSLLSFQSVSQASQQRVELDDTGHLQKQIQPERSKQIGLNGKMQEQSLRPEVCSLTKMIFGSKVRTEALREMGIQSKQMAMARISSQNISRAYALLSDIFLEVTNPTKTNQQLKKMTQEFLQEIPIHRQTKRVGELFDSYKKIKVALDALRTIESIKVHMEIADSISTPLQQNYHLFTFLKKDISVVEPNTPEFDLVNQFLLSTRPSIGNNKVEVEGIFKLPSNRHSHQGTVLLWHGTKLIHVVNIIRNGLRLPCKQVPSGAYTFGRALYFTDMGCKAIGYCGLSHINPKGCLFLCEVDLGNTQQKYYPQEVAGDSVKGVGRFEPKGGEKWQDIYVPNGPPGPSGIVNTCFIYNKYAVYEQSRVQCRFMVVVRLCAALQS